MKFIEVDLSKKASIDAAFAKLPPVFEKFFSVADVIKSTRSAVVPADRVKTGGC